MTTLVRRVAGGLRALFQRARVEQELDAELREFFEAAVERKMRDGLRREDAVRAARVELGSVAAVKDRVRDAGWESLVESIWQDVRYGGRLLRRSPGFTATAIAILALGIGANTAIFTLINAIMLRPLPVRAPEQLVEPLNKHPTDPRRNGFSWEFYEHVRDHNHVFTDVIGLSPARFEVTRDGAEAETLDGEYVVGTLFPVLGLKPAIGRLIEPPDGQAGAAPVAVVSWSYWKRRFNLDPAIVGAGIKINGAPATIVGVTPRAFVGLRPGVIPAVWIPVTRPMSLGLLARLKPGVSIEQARAELSVLQRPRLEELARKSGDLQWLHSKTYLEPAGAGLSALRDFFSTPLQVLMAVVGLILLIACTNIASIVLARGAARRREMAVRVSLGAGRLRLARQVLTESLLLSTVGSLLGLAIGSAGAGALVRIITSPRNGPGWPAHLDLQLAPDLRVLLFIAGIALATGVLFGLAPAWSAFRSAPITALREIGTAGEAKSRRMFGQGLVAAQVALSMVLLTAAGLLVGHLSNLRNLNLGFQRESVLIVSLNPRGSGLDRIQLTRLYADLLDRLHAIPGVRSAALAAVTPIEGGAASRFAKVEGSDEKPEERRRLWENWVGPKYFETLGTPLVAGRDFRFDDAGHPRVAIVNQTMARHYFGDASPLGKHFTFENDAVPFEIVGVAVDAKYADLHEPAPPTVYLNAFQERGAASTFALRTSVAPTAVAPAVRGAITEVLPTVQVAKVTTLTDQVDASLLVERVMAMLSGLFGALGASLAAMGLYGLLAYTVARRTSEIGVRMALGATERDVTRMILKSALALVAVGLLAGAPVAAWSARVAAGLIPNLHAGGALPVVVLAALVMIAIAVVAAYVPARRAARINPTDALRHS
jgi:putative ABC transport system permease protein